MSTTMTGKVWNGLATSSGTSGCYIGSLQLHTANAERDECIWCGPRMLAWKAGRWVEMTDDIGPEGYKAWTTWGPLTREQSLTGDPA